MSVLPRTAALGAVASLVLATLVALDGAPAGAAENRYSLSAQGDSQYFEVDGDDIPLSPHNEAGSLTAFAQLDNIGGSTAFAAAPYYWQAVETFPGTFNGLPGQFGFGQFQLPFARFPGYVSSSYPTTPEASNAQGYYSVVARSGEHSSTAHATNGAPDEFPAPNKQQLATAESTLADDGSTVASAEGDAAAVVAGPLEIANSVAKAAINDRGDKPVVDSTAFGRFSVAGQQFGFDKSGFTYLGQSQDSKAAVRQADDALRASGIQLDIAPQTTAEDQATGRLTYSIGGLKLTMTERSATGANYTVAYILGRVVVSSVNVALQDSSTSTVTRSAATLGSVPTAARGPVRHHGNADPAANPIAGGEQSLRTRGQRRS